MLRNLKRLLRSEKAEANYISATVYVLIAVIFLSFILSVFSLVSAKIQLDQAADQIVKQIQLAGGINRNTQELISFTSDNLPNIGRMRYTIDADYLRPIPYGNAIQLGTPFYLTLTAEAKLGGFWRVLPVKLSISSRAAGVSEVHWK